ncbi:DUF2946 family protein [Polynucleobacter kasalickyi]|uniref:DUF2946 family protein n=1 Tax=Polynucleobacter kasalickyi TaxID=1938817 RepID=A0A1W1YK06_9BURK|nr:DUF2946 family protein [Polynucleobacter kasalickyi]SMC36453.1 Protein of unknown function [Polynucleobacter kasalickyi]
MDDSTISAIAKWPNVPFCYGWLFLDRRGVFRIRNEYSQQNNLQGEVIKHSGLCDSIKKHICIDDHQQYFYQNGPQRVYLNLAYCPYVVRILPHQESQWILQNHLDQEITPSRCFLDEKGNVLLECVVSITRCTNYPEMSFTEVQLRTVALLHDHDLDIFSELSKMDVSSCGIKGVFQWNHLEIPIEPMMSGDVMNEFQFKTIPTAS